MESAEKHIRRWEGAGLIDRQTAAAIRVYEQALTPPNRKQWQTLLALLLGAILLGAGAVLFASAHWDQVPPALRMGLVLLIPLFFHGLALLARKWSQSFATAMHAAGTVASGSAIALAGQTFDLQAHWSLIFLFWTVCAGAGWLLLRDQWQETCTWLLLSATVLTGWADRVGDAGGAHVYVARISLVTGMVFLTAFLHASKRGIRRILFAAGALTLPTAVGILSTGWSAPYPQWRFVPLSYRAVAACLLGGIALLGALRAKESTLPILVAAGLAYALPWAQTTAPQESTFSGKVPSLLAYTMVAVAALILVGWGVRHQARALVNYSILAFAGTVLWFYFASVLSNLSRSVGLVTVGALFLAGGWLLEHIRRRLLKRMSGSPA